MQDKFFGVYVHIPFCDGKCAYCNFVSQVAGLKLQSEYFKALEKEICDDALNMQKIKNQQRIVNSVYFGGGTPSVVSEKHIIKTLNLLKQKFNFAPNAEISIECNPCSASLEKLRAYKQAGFSRISFGAQSFEENELAFLGRRHNLQQIFDAVTNALIAGFENINLDLILGASAGVNLKNLESNIKKMKKLGVKHFSVYLLTLEQGTTLFRRVEEKKCLLPSDDIVIEMFLKVQKILHKQSFKKYEVSNFACNGFQCLHNINYWRLGEFAAYGVAAHSFFNGARCFLTNDIKKYIDISQKAFKKTDYNFDVLSLEDKDTEYIMLGLRMVEGVEFLKIKTFDLKQKVNDLNQLKNLGLLSFNENKVWLTDKGFCVANQVILRLLP